MMQTTLKPLFDQLILTNNRSAASVVEGTTPAATGRVNAITFRTANGVQQCQCDRVSRISYGCPHECSWQYVGIYADANHGIDTSLSLLAFRPILTIT